MIDKAITDAKFGQMVRFGMVGIASNVVLFLGFIILSHLGMGHKTAMTVVFFAGVLQTFLANKKWTFAHQGSTVLSFSRYIFAYALAYLFNLVILYIVVDKLGCSYVTTHGVMVFLVAGLLFFMQRYWIFKT